MVAPGEALPAPPEMVGVVSEILIPSARLMPVTALGLAPRPVGVSSVGVFGEPPTETVVVWNSQPEANKAQLNPNNFRLKTSEAEFTQLHIGLSSMAPAGDSDG